MKCNPFLTRMTAFLLILALAGSGCASPSSAKIDRAPSRAPVPEDPEIYRYHGLLAAPPLQYLLTFVARKGLKIYLKRIPLETDVRDRLYQNIESDKFAKFFVPFVLAAKDLYVAAKKMRKNNFRKHILGRYPERNGVGGLSHSLFQYPDTDVISTGESNTRDDAIEGDERDETGERDPDKKTSVDNSHDAMMIASAITILDAVFLQNPEFSLGQPPKRDDATVARVVPATLRLIESLKATTEVTSPAYSAIESMGSNPARVRATAAVLIDVVHFFAYKHYQMFAGRYLRKIEMRKRLGEEFTKDPRALGIRLAKEAKERKFAVQIMVDGLQGHLIEALVNGKSSSPFLKAIHREKMERESYRPQKIPYRLLPDTQDDFFEAFMTHGGYRDPAYLPFFRTLYRSHVKGIARSGNSTTPTISARNIPIIETGAPVEGVGATHIVNMHFINRKQDRAYYFFGNDAILQASIAHSGGMRTLAQRLPEMDSLNCMAPFEEGYHWSIDPLVNIALGESSRDFGEILCLRDLSVRSKNQAKLHHLKEKFARRTESGNRNQKKLTSILDAIAELENESMPQLLTFFIPWPDHFAHYKGPFSDEIISPTGELNRLDYWLSRLAQIYDKSGVARRTVFAMAGDHGLTPVRYLLNPEKAVFGSLIDEGFVIKVNKISSDEGEGPKLTDPVHPPTQHGFDVVVASTAGGNYMVDFFLDQDKNWERQPVYSELQKYLLLEGRSLNMIDESLKRLDTTLDFLVVREEPCSPSGGVVRAVGLRNGNKSDAVIIRRGERIFYSSPSDLLQVRTPSPYAVSEMSSTEKSEHQYLLRKCLREAVPAVESTWCNEREWRELASFTPRPDSVVQLSHLYDIESAGTMNLFPAPYVGYNSLVPGRHAGELFMEKDAFIGFWGKRVKLDHRIGSAVNGSMAPTLYEYLTGEQSGGAANGWGYPSLLEP